jgi:transcriptional activator HAC1
MATMESDHQASPNMISDNSPTESFISTPREAYSPLFAAASPSGVPGTMNPLDMMSPDYDDEDHPTKLEDAEDATIDGLTPSASDKKPTKKRKSWGQVLPEPKTNLPPRKRAKTEDEKEQRRVERVLRNRRAAQSSRERKRKEVEALEDKNKQLIEALNKAQKENDHMARQLADLQRRLTSVDKSVTLSQELFSSQDGLKNQTETPQAPQLTVNPASLSPELGPVSDTELANVQEAAPVGEAKPSKKTTSPVSDLTQCPAAMLCNDDLQCQSETAAKAAFLESLGLNPQFYPFLHTTMTFLASALLSACRQPLIRIV